jgi:hypothetical protein
MRKLAALLFVFGFVMYGVAFGDDDKDKDHNKCPDFAVSVGYADTDKLQHPNDGAGFLPTPWNGSPGVIFIGTPGDNAEFDAGAIKIDNLSKTSPLTVNHVSVDIGTDTGIDVWDLFLPKVVPAGESLILTGTLNIFNFDTSDLPIFQCIPDGFIPIVHVTVGGSQQQTNDYVDKDQVLNTTGFDTGACPPFKNEGHEWEVVKQKRNKCACREEREEDDDR